MNGEASALWSLVSREGVWFVRCRPLEQIPGVRHLFSTRRAEGEDFDLGGRAGTLRAARVARLLRAGGLRGELRMLAQVHGTTLRVPEEAVEAQPPGDGWLWDARRHAGYVVAVATADCVPVLVVDARGQRAALLHAGWRGIAGGILERALEALERQGSPPAQLRLALGPAIGGCCYEVDPERWCAVRGAEGPREEPSAGAVRLDLREALRQRAVRRGVAREAIFSAPWCTRCRADLFFSYRSQGTSAGRMLACFGAGSAAVPARGTRDSELAVP